MLIFKYIFKLSTINTLISSLVIIGLVWVSQSFRSIKFILEKGGSFFDFLKLSIFSMPSWFSISISFGIFFGVFLTFNKLENEKELIAMKSSGLNAIQLSSPIITLSLILSTFLFLNFHFLLPNSYSFYKNYEDHLRYKKPQILINEGSFFHVDKKTFFAKSIKGNNMKKIFIKDYSLNNQTVDIFAQNAFFIFKNNDINIKLENGTKIITKQNEAPVTINFSEDFISFKSNQTKQKNKADRVIDLKEFTFFELLHKSNKEPNSKGVYLAEAHSRNIFSLMPLIFCMLFLSLFLRIQHSRYDSFFKKFIIISIIFSVQIIMFSLKNIFTKLTDYIYIFYLFPLLLLLSSYFMIKFEKISVPFIKR